MAILLGIDLGTSGVKVLALDDTGDILAVASHNYPLYHPRPGWAEQDAEDWWQGVQQAVRTVLGKDAVDRSVIQGLAVSGQMHGAVFLDSQGEVIRRPILWNDTRTFRQCDQITRAIVEEVLIGYTGNPALEGFTAPKVLWLRDNEPEHFNRLATLLLPKDYILYRLTGRLCTDVSDAAGTLLFDVENQQWSHVVIDKLDLDDAMLPEVLNSVDVVGKLTPEAAAATGLSEKVSVITGGADNACSAVGNGIVSDGEVLASLGSSGTVVAYTDEMHRDPKGRIHSFNHAVPHCWYLMGVMLSAAASFKWFREEFGQLESALAQTFPESAEELLTRQAAGINPGSEGLLFLPYLSGERTPHRDAKARGVFFGISPIHTKAHFARAVLEGVAFGMRDCLELVEDLGITPTTIRLTGGGAKSPLWRQMMADVLGKPLVTTNIEEGPAIGAALLAGTGAGVFSSVKEAVAAVVTVTDTIQPNEEPVWIYDTIYPLYQNLYHSLQDDFTRAFDVFEQLSVSSIPH